MGERIARALSAGEEGKGGGGGDDSFMIASSLLPFLFSASSKGRGDIFGHFFGRIEIHHF